jgi:hypothetical protein
MENWSIGKSGTAIVKGSEDNCHGGNLVCENIWNKKDAALIKIIEAYSETLVAEYGSAENEEEIQLGLKAIKKATI